MQISEGKFQGNFWILIRVTINKQQNRSDRGTTNMSFCLKVKFSSSVAHGLLIVNSPSVS